jgi:ribose-phosphate pyrophosphokinase
VSVEFLTQIGPGAGNGTYLTTPTFEGMFFPAGEAHVKVINENDHKGPLTEIAFMRGADGNDLMQVAMWSEACEQRGSRKVLLLPYLPGARQDRGLPFGAQVYASHLSMIQPDVIVCFDPHSAVLTGILRDAGADLRIVHSDELVARTVIVGTVDSDVRPNRYDGIIAPDAGALHRAQAVAARCHLPLYQAFKKRDPDTGKLSGFGMVDKIPDEGRLLIVDDICDGGATFKGLAEATGLGPNRLSLYVSHGIFSADSRSGRDETVRSVQGLSAYFGAIHTTDSYRNDLDTFGWSRLHVTPIRSLLLEAAK